MHRTYRNARERACDCRCPIHYGRPRSIYNNPDCHCRATCASQPMTLLAPQINGAVFLDITGALWYVPSLEPGPLGLALRHLRRHGSPAVPGQHPDR